MHVTGTTRVDSQDLLPLLRRIQINLDPTGIKTKMVNINVRSCETNQTLEVCDPSRHSHAYKVYPGKEGEYFVTVYCKGASVRCTSKRSSPVQIVVEVSNVDKTEFELYESNIFYLVARRTGKYIVPGPTRQDSTGKQTIHKSHRYCVDFRGTKAFPVEPEPGVDRIWTKLVPNTICPKVEAEEQPQPEIFHIDWLRYGWETLSKEINDF